MRLDFELSSGTEADVGSIREVVDLFALGVRLNLFWAGTPGRWDDAEWTGSGSTFCHTAGVAGIRAADFRVLANLIVQCVHTGDPVSSVRISARSEPEDAGTTDAVLSAALADSPATGERQCGPLQGRRLTFSMEFDDAISDDDVDDICEALHVWDQLVFMGGYSESYERQEGFVPCTGETFLDGDRVLIHDVGFFTASAVALSGIRRLLASLTSRGLSGRLIRVESAPVFTAG